MQLTGFLAMNTNEELDTTGLLCPLPVLKAAKRLRSMPSGATLSVIADDPAGLIDFPHFCSEQGHKLLSATENDGVQTYRIQKA